MGRRFVTATPRGAPPYVASSLPGAVPSGPRTSPSRAVPTPRQGGRSRNRAVPTSSPRPNPPGAAARPAPRRTGPSSSWPRPWPWRTMFSLAVPCGTPSASAFAPPPSVGRLLGVPRLASASGPARVGLVTRGRSGPRACSVLAAGTQNVPDVPAVLASCSRMPDASSEIISGHVPAYSHPSPWPGGAVDGGHPARGGR